MNVPNQVLKSPSKQGILLIVVAVELLVKVFDRRSTTNEIPCS